MALPAKTRRIAAPKRAHVHRTVMSVESGGWALAALALVALGYFVPMRIRAKRLDAQSCGDDRFSTSLRLLNTASVVSVHDSAYRPLIHQNREGGAAMTSPHTKRLVPVKENRELVAARAQWAADSARRQAQAQRRFFVAITLLIAEVVLIALALWSLVPAWAFAVPTVALAALLPYSRFAATKGVQADQLARQRLDKAKRNLARLQPPVPVSNRRKQALELSLLTAHDRQQDLTDAEASAGSQETLSADTDTTQRAGQSLSAERKLRTSRLHADGTWTPMSIPLPTYQLKPMIQPRLSISTQAGEEAASAESAPARDIAVRLPYRPRQITQRVAGTVSTTEIMDGALVKLDLDKILDDRRAVAG